MKNISKKWYAVFVTHCKYLVFETHEEAWKYAESVFATTGNVVAVETIN